MSLMDNPNRLNAEEFEDEFQDTISRIAELYNFHVDQVTNVINGDLDYDNLSIKDKISINITVDSSGNPLQTTQFTSNTGLIGTTVLRAVNTTTSTNYPSGTPFISWSTNGDGTYTINNITNLTANETYTLVIELTF